MSRVFIVLFLFMMVIPSPIFAQQKIPILVYHSIAEYKGVGSKELYVTPKNFEDQMRYLRDHGFTLLTFEQWQEIDKVDKPIFITLDDGYKNNLNVLTIFRTLESDRFKPSATLFVVTDYIGGTNRLNSVDIQQLVKSNFFSIQSHTATHPDLTKIGNYQYELDNSKNKLEQITGRPVMALSYPYGNANQKVVEETKKYYQFGLTTTPSKFVKQGTKDELYLLPRIYIKYSTTLDEFAKIVAGD
jgi:peptidoglycan/xylan/chitin deacetylase (PgdA/CDA1 family)